MDDVDFLMVVGEGGLCCFDFLFVNFLFFLGGDVMYLKGVEYLL